VERVVEERQEIDFDTKNIHEERWGDWDIWKGVVDALLKRFQSEGGSEGICM